MRGQRSFWLAVAVVAVLAAVSTAAAAAMVRAAQPATTETCRITTGATVTAHQADHDGCTLDGQPVPLMFYDCTDGSTLVATGPMGDPDGYATLLVPDEGVWEHGDWTSLWSTCTRP